MTYFYCQECRLEFEDPVPGRNRCKECCSYDIVEISPTLLEPSAHESTSTINGKDFSERLDYFNLNLSRGARQHG